MYYVKKKRFVNINFILFWINTWSNNQRPSWPHFQTLGRELKIWFVTRCFWIPSRYEVQLKTWSIIAVIPWYLFKIFSYLSRYIPCSSNNYVIFHNFKFLENVVKHCLEQLIIFTTEIKTNAAFKRDNGDRKSVV